MALTDARPERLDSLRGVLDNQQHPERRATRGNGWLSVSRVRTSVKERTLRMNDRTTRAAEIAAQVADWPPLTQAQRDRLRMVFASRRTTEERRAA